VSLPPPPRSRIPFRLSLSADHCTSPDHSFSDPTVATAVVAEGTIQDYDSYQTSVNSVVYASATAADAAVSAANAGRILDNNMAGMVGWAAVAVGAIGGAAGLILV
jgi:hypothetical protein